MEFASHTLKTVLIASDVVSQFLILFIDSSVELSTGNCPSTYETLRTGKLASHHCVDSENNAINRFLTNSRIMFVTNKHKKISDSKVPATNAFLKNSKSLCCYGEKKSFARDDGFARRVLAHGSIDIIAFFFIAWFFVPNLSKLSIRSIRKCGIISIAIKEDFSKSKTVVPFEISIIFISRCFFIVRATKNV